MLPIRILLHRSRKEYVKQLRKDLCLRYDYNEFLMGKLMDLFPSEVSFVFSKHLRFLAFLGVQRDVLSRN